MSQQPPPGYGPPPGSQGQPPYGQPPGQPPNYQPQQPSPNYQPQQPPPGYQQQPPPGYPQGAYPPQASYGPPPVAPKMVVPTRVVENADGFERTLSLLAYIWVAFYVGVASLIVLRIPVFRNTTGEFSFNLNFEALIILALPFIILAAVKSGELVRFHARQALYLGIALMVARVILQLLYLIPSEGVQDVLVRGILQGGIEVVFAAAALYAGVRAFYNRENYRLPLIGSFVKES